MFNASLRIVQDSNDAEDVMQEAFLSAFTKLDTFKGEVPFGAWLKRIVINKSLTLIKKKSKLSEVKLEVVGKKLESDNESEEEDEDDNWTGEHDNWKTVAPKPDEQTSKTVNVTTWNWCLHHSKWCIHTSDECRLGKQLSAQQTTANQATTLCNYAALLAQIKHQYK